jgi:predicted O-methyltransferase YrrM
MFRIGMAAVMGLLLLCWTGQLAAADEGKAVDEKVKRFLDKMKGRWRDLNVPEEDGKILYEIVVKNRYRRALEVGTSTGHSAVWIAWALSKTGGRLITLEIDEGRRRQALANFREAGLDGFIDARLGDAHRLVKELPGPFDFVFIDADKESYPEYARALAPKIDPGGCLTAHNVDEIGGSGPAEYFRYLKSLPGFETFIHPRSRYGVAVSYKKK